MGNKFDVFRNWLVKLVAMMGGYARQILVLDPSSTCKHSASERNPVFEAEYTLLKGCGKRPALLRIKITAWVGACPAQNMRVISAGESKLVVMAA